MLQCLWLVPLGFLVGAYGTLIGAGGGFVLVPILMLIYPKESPDTITGISLAVVFFNALSGSLAYSRMGRIDYKSGRLFAIATIPGAILGALTVSWMPRRLFDVIFGVLMIAVCIFLILQPARQRKICEQSASGTLERKLIEADGTLHTYSYKPVLGMLFSLGVGYLSSLLGIGGGIIHVPILVCLLDFPIHVATATSQFILAIMAFVGAIVHIRTGTLNHVLPQIAALSVGVVFGAPIGARLSNRMQGSWIIRSLGIALGLVGLRIVAAAL
ncbi:MAG: sulfite exporter TauE/SafE family protein [Armatimonadota bacterium]